MEGAQSMVWHLLDPSKLPITEMKNSVPHHTSSKCVLICVFIPTPHVKYKCSSQQSQPEEIENRAKQSKARLNSETIHEKRSSFPCKQQQKLV